MFSVCRICLVGNTTLHSVKNNLLISFYENLTNSKLNSEDARPRALCCFCYQKLLRCHNFSQMALRSEKIFSHLCDNGLEVTEYITEFNLNMKQRLSVATMQFITIDRHSGSQVTVKDEPLPCTDATGTVSIELDNLVEGCTRSHLTYEDNNVHENYEDELLFNIPAEQTIPDDSKITFTCDICNKIFNLKSKLISHIIIAHSLSTVKHSTGQNTGTSRMNEDKILINVKKQFACNECDKKYDYKSALTRHVITHTGEKPFPCNICGRKFAHKNALVSHIMNIHLGHKPFACDICDKKNYRNYNLVTHMRTHSGDRPFACKQCDKQFYRKHHLVRHIKIHMKEKPFVCNICGGQFAQKKGLVSHKNFHAGHKPFTCDICDKKFHLKQCLVQHIKIHMKKKPFPCLPCLDRTEEVNTKRDKFVGDPKVASTKIQLELEDSNSVQENDAEELLHSNISGEQSKPDDSNITFSCDMCKKIFDKKSKLISHIRAHSLPKVKQHSSTLIKKQFSCDICDKKINTKQNFVSHMRTHSGDRPFACKRCDKQFYRKHHLVRHIKIHMKEKPFVLTEQHPGTTSMYEDEILHYVKKQFSCDACDKKYDHKSAFTRHLRTHTGEKPYACDTCGKHFNRKSTIVLHIRTHTGEKPFACNLCGKKFAQKKGLASHKTIHAQHKPFACDICDKKFNLKHNFVSHMRTHSGDRPFACKQCDKQFYRKHHLVRHMIKHVGEEPFVCNECHTEFYQKAHLILHIRSHAPHQ